MEVRHGTYKSKATDLLNLYPKEDRLSKEHWLFSLATISGVQHFLETLK